jgi:DNA adenine methylase
MGRNVRETLTDGAVRAAFRSPLRYPGGKQKAISQISAMLPSGHVGEYREPMVGGGSVFFHARSMDFAKSYWLNDQFQELVAFWRAAQDQLVCQRLVGDLHALHAEFGDDAAVIKEFFLRARKEGRVSAYRQALLFFFFNRVTFSGTTRAGGFSAAAAISRFTVSSIDRLRAMPEALAGVRVSCEDFSSVILEPGKDVFLFLDPPYFTADRLYGRNGALHSFDHATLAGLLRKTPHRFLVTYDDCPEIRELYSWANVTTWSLQYGMNNCSKSGLSKRGAELFIKNY